MSMGDQLPPSDKALASRRLRPGPRQRDPWESQPISPRLGSRTRTVFMMRASGAASRSRGTQPPLETVIESPSTSRELLPVSALQRGDLVTGVVTMTRPQQITLALESQRDVMEPIVTLGVATLKHGDPIEKGMRLSGLAIAFVQQEKGFYLVQPSDCIKITRNAPSPTPPTSSAVASASAAPRADTQHDHHHVHGAWTTATR